jgi:hypothetical protein
MLVADGRIVPFGSRLVDWERGEKIVLSRSRPSSNSDPSWSQCCPPPEPEKQIIRHFLYEIQKQVL